MNVDKPRDDMSKDEDRGNQSDERERIEIADSVHNGPDDSHR